MVLRSYAVLAASALALAGVGPTMGAAPARADLVLNEIFYDPAGPDEGAEWIELWNPDPVPRQLGGIAIESADGSRPDNWTVLFRGAPTDTVPPGRAFLVSASALAGALQNGPDALRLTRDGAAIDLLGYGALEAASLYEGVPAPDATSGRSLARREDGLDSDRNADDWVEETGPTPGRANHPNERLVLIRGSVAIDPLVPWPGETAVVRARVANRGRLPLAASRWRLIVEWNEVAGAREGTATRIAATVPGVPLAPGESVAVQVSVEVPAPGPIRARVRTAPEDPGVPPPGLPASPPGDLADTAMVAGRVLAGPIVVNEISFRDAGDGEWIEIWLRDPVSDIGLFALADGSSLPRPIQRGPTPRPVLAGGYLVIAQDPPAVRSRYGLDSSAVLGVAGTWPSLNDTNAPGGLADMVRVLGADSIPSDAVVYDARAVARGGTLERLSPDLPGSLASSFGECVDAARATPGRPNSLRAPDRSVAPRGALLLAGGRVLRRGGGPPLLLRVTAEARGRSLVVQVFDLLGRRVRTLVQGHRFASEGAFAWDGRDAEGSWVRPGLYVITAEALGEGGRAPRRTAIPVAVAAGGVGP